MNRVVVDTGPLVALLNSRDGYHAWARDRFAEIAPPLRTCEAVLSETCFLLGKTTGGTEAVLSLLEREVVTLGFTLADEIRPVGQLMRRYASVPMSLADACLVRMTELDERATLLTVDADFGTYRRNGRQRIPLITPHT